MWIKLYRKFTEWEWYQDINCKVVFLHLLLTANWEPKKWQGIVIDAGELVTSNASLAEEVSLSVDQVRLALKKLVDCGAITRKSTNRFTHISIKNFKTYQSNPKHQSKAGEGIGGNGVYENPKQTPNKSQTEPKQIPTPKELKKDRIKDYKDNRWCCNNNIYNINNRADEPNTNASAPTDENGKVFSDYERNIGVLSPVTVDILKDRITAQGAALVSLAIVEAVKNNAKSIRYIEAVLNTWADSGVTTEEAAKLKISEHRNRKSQKKDMEPGNVAKSSFRNYPQDYSLSDAEKARVKKMLDEFEEDNDSGVIC